MPQIRLNIPTLYYKKKEGDKGRMQYYVRSVFLSSISASDSNANRAQSKYEKIVCDYIESFSLSKDNLAKMQWLSFAAPLKYKQISLEFRLTRVVEKCTVGIIFFTLKGNTFVSVPSLGDYMFIASNSTDFLGQVKKDINSRILNLYKAAKEGGYDFELADYTSSAKEMMRHVSVVVNLSEISVQTQTNDELMKMLLHSFKQFHGADEIKNIATSFNRKTDYELGWAFYRDEIVKKVQAIIYGKKNIPLVLLGEKGVGKHSIIHQAHRNYKQQKKKSKSKVVYDDLWHLHPQKVIVGMSNLGDWERRLESAISFIRKPDTTHLQRKDKLLVDKPVELIHIGRSYSSDMTIANVLKPYLEERNIQLVILATSDEWKFIQEENRSFADLFQLIRVDPPDLKTTIKIACKQRRILEDRESVSFSMQAVKEVFELHENYFKSKVFPGFLIDMMGKLARKHTSGDIDAFAVREEFEVFSNYKSVIYDDEVEVNYKELEKYFQSNLVGQDDAIKALVSLVLRIKSKLSNPSKPLGSFFFTGPTGVGKTQAAKLLAAYLTGDEKNLLRLDMNEYVDATAIDRLIGGYNNLDGELIGKVRHQPFSIILLDEIEKAYPDVRDLLLQVLDDGRLTDREGRTVDFSNTIIIMTSNVGAEDTKYTFSFMNDVENESQRYRTAIEKEFLPEFINRIDEVIVFKPLEVEHILNIARLQIQELLTRDGFVRRTTLVSIQSDALEWVARRGYDNQMGGRALKRQIEVDLTELSAEQLVSTYSKQPIILEIVLKDGKLEPIITPLDYIRPSGKDVLPQLPVEGRGVGFYHKLLGEVKELYEEMSDMNPFEETVINTDGKGGTNWQYYDLKTRILDLEQELKSMSLGFRDGKFAVRMATPMRVKSIFHTGDYNYTTYQALKTAYTEKLFQDEGLKELVEDYQSAQLYFNAIDTEMMNYYLKVELLKVAFDGFVDDMFESITLEFKSLVKGLGDKEMKYLFSIYEELFKDMGLAYTIGKKKKTIKIEGYNVYELLKNEHGIYLFHKMDRNPIPIAIRVSKDGDENENAESLSQKVLRVYVRNTVTDLRTGLSNPGNLTVQEMRFFVCAGYLNTLTHQNAEE